MPPGFVTLGQVAARLPTLDVACNRCDRRGRLHTGPLALRHGPGFPMPERRGIVAADCRGGRLIQINADRSFTFIM